MQCYRAIEINDTLLTSLAFNKAFESVPAKVLEDICKGFIVGAHKLISEIIELRAASIVFPYKQREKASAKLLLFYMNMSKVRSLLALQVCQGGLFDSRGDSENRDAIFKSVCTQNYGEIAVERLLSCQHPPHPASGKRLGRESYL